MTSVHGTRRNPLADRPVVSTTVSSPGECRGFDADQRGDRGAKVSPARRWPRRLNPSSRIRDRMALLMRRRSVKALISQINGCRKFPNPCSEDLPSFQKRCLLIEFASNGESAGFVKKRRRDAFLLKLHRSDPELTRL